MREGYFFVLESRMAGKKKGEGKNEGSNIKWGMEVWGVWQCRAISGHSAGDSALGTFGQRKDRGSVLPGQRVSDQRIILERL